ncbi:MAG TPA: phosphonate ABC transporter, permease protein PhnE [Candidatus Saccharimonadales bacterium]|jgi:phosphonate transport system permease protein|nr:phosphonate ABC transporter, permease protein PhnE [Candidatus Saccharimonadales bacterium]
MSSGLNHALSNLRHFFPPEINPSYLKAALGTVLETVEIALAATFLAILFGLLISLYIGARLPGARLLYAALASLRAVPDLTLAIFCVVLLGLGKAAGTAALALFYTAALGKIFSDLFASADPAPVEALHSTGATRVMVALFGLLPLRLKDMLSYGAYEFESVIRAATIVGAVGAGGLGTELIGSINQFDYPRVTTLVLMLVALVAIVDQISLYVRRYPKLLLIFMVCGAAALWTCLPEEGYIRHAAETYQRMLQPKMPESLLRVPGLVLETLEIAFGGTLLAMVFALPLSAAAARNLTPWFIHFPARRVLEFLRAIPEVVWGLILIGMAGLGPRIGILALGLHSTGSLGRLYSESLENVPEQAVASMTSTGASRIAIIAFAHLPLAFGPMSVHSLFRLEWNMRAAAVVGLISAGGIGQALFDAQQLFHYQEMSFYLIVTWGLVMTTDLINTQVRRRWGVAKVQSL